MRVEENEGSWGVSGRFDDLVALQAKLLGPKGCPWDREQTHESLRTYLLEETYEVLEALDAKDFAKLPEELGDLLLQIVFHAELARRAGRFEIGDVVERVYAKLVRRHPHVFGDAKAADAQAVLKNWEQLKAQERETAGKKGEQEDRESLLDGIPRTLPATLEAYQMTRRASRIRFDWETLDELLEKVKEEAEEVKRAAASGNRTHLEEEIGDLLFVAVNAARFLEMDPEIALKKTNRKFGARFREMEREVARQGRRLAEVSREELEAQWERAKRLERESARGKGGGENR
jgi:MazG family protein